MGWDEMFTFFLNICTSLKFWCDFARETSRDLMRRCPADERLIHKLCQHDPIDRRVSFQTNQYRCFELLTEPRVIFPTKEILLDVLFCGNTADNPKAGLEEKNKKITIQTKRRRGTKEK